MLTSTFTAGAALLGLAAASPYSPFPLPNGFPTPASSAIVAIQTAAGGSLPNSAPPANATAGDATALQLIALNEIFEVAYFTELVANITNNVTGYSVPAPWEKSQITKIFQKIIAQEELHALEANGALMHFGKQPIQPCQYNFPVTNLNQSIALAQTFTDLVLGTLQDANELFATSGANLTRLVDSIIGQEGEQVGFFRTFQYKAPSAAPFLSTSAAQFAFTALQSFIIPGSCPNINQINIPTFKPLTVVNQTIPAKDGELYFSWTKGTQAPTSIVYITGQNVPMAVNFTSVSTDNNTVTVKANFPFISKGFADGLTIAAATNSSGPFTSADQVAAATLFGPGLIEVS